MKNSEMIVDCDQLLVGQQEEAKKVVFADYQHRKLDYCHFCGDSYNVGEKIPRILIHCGHTFCTECLSCLHHNFRVRCPLCRKLIKNIESVEKLPLNINILYEIVERDPQLNSIDFDDDDSQDLESKLCEKHDQRVNHFYCSNHQTVFCRECIKDYHTDDSCFVVDLYEIEKMRKLQSQNIRKNREQLKKRNEPSCVIIDAFKASKCEKRSQKLVREKAQLKEKAIVLKTKMPANIDPSYIQAALFGQSKQGVLDYLAMKNDGAMTAEDCIMYDYENEPTDEARTNEEVFEDQNYPKFLAPKGRIIDGQCVFFNEECDDEDENSAEEDGSSQELEDGEVYDGQEVEVDDDEEEEEGQY